MKRALIIFSGLLIFLASCKKDKTTTPEVKQDQINTWTFDAEGKTYKGGLFWDPLLNPLLQDNNSYTFTVLGAESTGKFFNVVLSLLDTTFTHKTYQSGASHAEEYINAFYFFENNSIDNIYKSSNYDLGPVMDYTIESYNPDTRLLIMTFNGKAQKTDGSYTNIANGKLICKVERMK